METLNYTFHGMLTLQINRSKSITDDLVKVLRMHYHYFLDDSDRPADDSDVTVNIGPFTPSKDGCQCLDRKYYVKPDYLFYRESYRRLKYMVEIRGWETGKIQVNFNGNIFGLRALLAPNVIVCDHVIQPLLELRFGQTDQALSHSAGVVLGDRTWIISGRGGSYKTSFCMRFLQHGTRFMGDDYLIIGKQGSIHSFPTNLPVFEYRYRHLATEDLSLLGKIKTRLRYDPAAKPNAPFICDQARASCLVLLVPGNNGQFSISNADLDEGCHFLYINSLLEMMSSPFYYGFLAYTLLYPQGPIGLHYRRLASVLKESLSNIPVIRVSLPSQLNGDQLSKLLEELYKVCP